MSSADFPHLSDKQCRFLKKLGVEAVYLFGSRAMGQEGPLSDGTPRKRLQFETETTLLYCDYRPLLDSFDQTILQSL